jgi:hypothetical protein
MKFVQQSLNGTLDITRTLLFTDSTTVLCWLKTSPHLLKSYVSNRVTEILDLTSPQQWNHVSSCDNPADCASQGIYPIELIDHPLWWKGPPWMILPFEEWPLQNTAPVSLGKLPEMKSVALHSTSIEPEPFKLNILEQVSSLP